MNNAVFGKGMENVRRRLHVRLVNKKEQALRLISNPQYKGHDILDKNLVSFQLDITRVTLYKPIYTGFAVLELSKFFMYQFHMDYVQQKYAKCAQLLFTDTDSLTYQIQPKDIYKHMKQDSHLFDCSDYPKDNFFWSQACRLSSKFL